MGKLTTPVRLALQRLGLDIDRHSRSFNARRQRIMERMGVTCVIDIGANVGQYGLDLRREGYTGRILSVEPLADSYAQLAVHCRRDKAWDCLNVAMGRENGRCRINVAANRVSSSLLPMSALHQSAEPASAYQSTDIVEARRLDDVAGAFRLLDEGLAIKLDVQGYELEVLAGGERALAAALLLDCEVSFVELYDGQPLAGEMMAFILERGFRPIGVRQGFTDPRTDQALQADVLFARIQK